MLVLTRPQGEFLALPQAVRSTSMPQMGLPRLGSSRWMLLDNEFAAWLRLAVGVCLNLLIEG